MTPTIQEQHLDLLSPKAAARALGLERFRVLRTAGILKAMEDGLGFDRHTVELLIKHPEVGANNEGTNR